MHKGTNTESKAEMVERMGLFFEAQNLTPMHGRVFAYLLLAEPPYQDFYAIQDFLKASKSAISNALKFLAGLKLVEYKTIPGDRRRYFYASIDGWINLTKYKIRGTSELTQIVSDVIDVRGESDSEIAKKLKTLSQFQHQLDQALLTFLNEWESRE